MNRNFCVLCFTILMGAILVHPAYAIPLLQVGLVDGTGASFGASGADHKFSRPFGPGSSVNDIGLATYVDKGTELYVVQSGVDASFSAEFGSLRGAVGTIGQMAFDPLDRPVIYATAVGNGSASWSDTWRITGAAGPITNLNIKGHFDGSLSVDGVIGGGTPYCLTPDMVGQYRLLVGGSLIYNFFARYTPDVSATDLCGQDSISVPVRESFDINVDVPTGIDFDVTAFLDAGAASGGSADFANTATIDSVSLGDGFDLDSGSGELVRRGDVFVYRSTIANDAPEPASILLLIAGVLSLLCVNRERWC